MTLLIIDDLSAEVSKKKVNPTLLFPQPKPFILKDGGKLVPLENKRVYFVRATLEQLGSKDKIGYTDEYFEPDGAAHPKNSDDITWRIEQKDGSLTPAKPYSRSKTMQGMFAIDMAAIAGYVPDGVYEVYVNPRKYNEMERKRIEAKLFAKVKEFWNTGKGIMGQWVHREGSRPYAMILKPNIQEGEDGQLQFNFLMITSRTKLEFSHMMNAPSVAVKDVEAAEEPKTEELLKAFVT